jgi:hypothetical protein
MMRPAGFSCYVCQGKPESEVAPGAVGDPDSRATAMRPPVPCGASIAITTGTTKLLVIHGRRDLG